ncbi:hypothetical protein BSKO_00231 [Bryopsis sp. KO-2023]|nr:hypothetical protein BSKO_00231 [Bryopsis sp. KO-2023]
MHFDRARSTRVQNQAAVSVRNLRLSLGRGNKAKEVLRGVNLSLKPGKLHFLLGANGCGKSTLLRTIAGLYEQDSGEVSAEGPIGFVFQNPDHQVVLPTVAADVAFSLGSKNMEESEVKAMVTQALEAVGLLDFMNSSMGTLSGGQKQRVAIAGALVSKPKLLLLDELTTFIDREDQERVLRSVKDVVENDPEVTAIWVTHRLQELAYADTATYMDRGEVVLSGTPQEAKYFVRMLGANV